MADKFLKADILNSFQGGKNLMFEADEIEITQARECINANPRLKLGIQPRDGYAVDGSFSTATTPIKSANTFTTKNGLERPWRASGTILEYRNPYLTTPDWKTLQTGFTSGKIFGFASGDSKEYMANGVEVIRAWSGACSTFDKASSDATHIALNAQGVLTTAALLGFSSSGTVVINGTEYVYSAISGLLLTVTVDPTGQIDGEDVAETPDTTGFTSAPLGNILLIKDSRLCVAGVPDNENSVYGSKIGNVRSFAFSSPAVADDGFVVKFWGKPITALGDKGDYIAVMKKDGAKKIGFAQLRAASGDSILTVPKLDGIFDGEGLGAINMKGTIQSNLDFVFTSKEVGVRRITRIGDAQIDTPNSMMENIEDEFDTYDQTDPALGLLKQQIHLALRSSNKLSGNDLIIIKDQRTGFIGDYKGINASCFFVLDGELYYGDSFTKNCYKLYTGEYSDYDGTNYLPYMFVWKGKKLHFGYPEYFKKLGYLYIEGFITPNTDAELQLIFDTESGVESITKHIVGTDKYVYQVPANPLGYDPLGSTGLTSVEDRNLPAGARRFRRMFTSTDLSVKDWFEMQFRLKTDQDGGFIRLTKIRPFVEVSDISATKTNRILNNIT